MAKTNLRSFRYSDEVAAILEAQEGTSLNDKFENLVLYCFWNLDKLKSEYARYRKLLADTQEQLREYRAMVEAVERIGGQLTALEQHAANVDQLLSVTQNAGCLEQTCVTVLALESVPESESAESAHECRTCQFYSPEFMDCKNVDGPMWLDMVDVDSSCHCWDSL